MAEHHEDNLYESEIQSGGYGEANQKEVAALTLLLRMAKCSSNIRMTHAMKIANKFDEMVLIDDEGKHICFLQVKHDSVAKGDKAKDGYMEALFPTAGKSRGDFDMRKYLKSYVTVNHSIEQIEKEKDNTKKYYVITNKDLSTKDNEWVTIEQREVNAILRFPGSKAKHLKLNPMQKAINEMCYYINTGITDLKEAIKEFFNSEISKLFDNYSIPLRDVLTKENKKYRFSVNFNSETKQFSVAKLRSLFENYSFDMERQVLVEKDFFQKESRIKFLPPYVSEDEVKAFFRDFTSSVGQRNDFRSVVHIQLWVWMKTCLQPDILGGLGAKDLILIELRKFFEELNEPKEINLKRFLQKCDVKQSFSEILCKMDGVQGLLKDHQHIILVAVPSMGNTSLLQLVTFELQNQKDIHVFLVYFNALVKELNDIKNISDFNDALCVRSTVLSQDNCDFIRNALHQRDEGCHSIVLVMDGFDEIHSRYTEMVLEMLMQLSLKKSIKFVVSSRTHLKALLENDFNVTSMFLEPFSKDDQISYLRKVWSVPEDDEQSFLKYSECLLRIFHSSIASKLCEIPGLPLRMTMLAEIYSDKFLRFISVEKAYKRQQFDLSEGEFNIFQLYKQFVKKRFFKRFVEKYQFCGDLDEAEFVSVVGGYFIQHQLLAMKLMGIEIIEYLFKNPSYKEKYDKFKAHCEKESEKSLLVKVDNNNVQFSHLSYCEYFVVAYLCEHIGSLRAEVIIRILSDHDVIKKNTFMKLKESETNFMTGWCQSRRTMVAVIKMCLI